MHVQVCQCHETTLDILMCVLQCKKKCALLQKLHLLFAHISKNYIPKGSYDDIPFCGKEWVQLFIRVIRTKHVEFLIIYLPYYGNITFTQQSCVERNASCDGFARKFRYIFGQNAWLNFSKYIIIFLVCLWQHSIDSNLIDNLYY